MPKFKGEDKRKVSRYKASEKGQAIVGEGSGVHTIPVEIRSIGLGGSLVRILGAFARNENIVQRRTFILTIIGDGPLKGITASVKIVKVNDGAYGSKCLSLSFEGQLKGENYETFMRWRRHQSAIGRMMPSTTPVPH